jgi:hypothetical protein
MYRPRGPRPSGRWRVPTGQVCTGPVPARPCPRRRPSSPPGRQLYRPRGPRPSGREACSTGPALGGVRTGEVCTDSGRAGARSPPPAPVLAPLVARCTDLAGAGTRSARPVRVHARMGRWRCRPRARRGDHPRGCVHVRAPEAGPAAAVRRPVRVSCRVAGYASPSRPPASRPGCKPASV